MIFERLLDSVRPRSKAGKLSCVSQLRSSAIVFRLTSTVPLLSSYSHDSLPALLLGRTESNNLSNIILESLIEHSIGLVENEVFNASQLRSSAIVFRLTSTVPLLSSYSALPFFAVSATWPESVRRLASTFLTKPVHITVGSDELTANKRITQGMSA
jgi:hypothetical protein